MKNKIDYTHKYDCRVLVCWVKYKNKFLLLKRSDKVLAYKNMWSTLAGFLDDDKSLEEKIKEELREEIGLEEKDIIKISLGTVYEIVDEKINRKWITHPALCEINTPQVKLDWEHVDYRWITPDEIKNFDIVPNSLLAFEKISAHSHL